MPFCGIEDEEEDKTAPQIPTLAAVLTTPLLSYSRLLALQEVINVAHLLCRERFVT